MIAAPGIFGQSQRGVTWGATPTRRNAGSRPGNVARRHGSGSTSPCGKPPLLPGPGVSPVLPRGGPGCRRATGENAPHKAPRMISAGADRCECANDGTCWRNGGAGCLHDHETRAT